MHILIIGPPRVGKSTLINKVIKAVNRPVWGFATKKEVHLFDPDHGYPIYIYDADGPRTQTKANLIGYCFNHHPEVYTEVFNNFAPKLNCIPPQNSLILMDEIGFMESNASDFCNAIIRHLNGKVPVIAAVKDKTTPFLERVKNHPNCKCFYITKENRDILAEEVITYLKEQISKYYLNLLDSIDKIEPD